MKITKIDINNYRNLDGITINLHPVINFIVGENNLGKSNFLDLLNTLYNYNTFRENDFFDIDKPIKIEFTLILNEIEIGLFDDLFDPEQSDRINIVAIQETPEESINFKHRESDTIIMNSSIRCINYINYSSLRTPNNELNFDKNRGVGKFLAHLISKYFETEGIKDLDFIKEDETKDVLDFINSNISKIKSFKEFSINADLDKDIKNLLAKVIILTDTNNFQLKDQGHGIQFLSIITLTILEKILNMNKTRLAKSILQDSDSNNCMPILIGLDEPEVHLHPYMQRSLVKYLTRIVNNEDTDFRDLLKDVFGIDKLMGQVIVSTHSPNIILNDYKQIIRFHKDEDMKLIVSSGIDINLESNMEKHLLAQFTYIKEAFFSKGAIIVEGDSELSCLPGFGREIGIDFDDYGISIIKASGADSIKPIIILLDKYGIQSVGIMDKDKYKDSYKLFDNLFHTDGKDLEEDIIDNLISKDRMDILEDIVLEHDSKKLDRIFSEKALNKRIKSYNILINNVNKDYKISEIDKSDTDMVKLVYLTWFGIMKGSILGRMIGDLLKEDNIPSVYINGIEKIKELL